MRSIRWLSLPSGFGRIMTGGAYRPEIDGIRFLAIALVVIWHLVERLTRGYVAFAGGSITPDEAALINVVPVARVGVMLFFSVSGFILASRYFAVASEGQFSYRDYLIRRVSRIEPPYVVVLIGTFCFLTLTNYQPQLAKNFWEGPSNLGLSLLASLGYLHGLVFNELPRLFPGGWSLEIEVQFYLIAPLLFMAHRSITSDTHRLVVGGCVIAGAWIIAEASIAVLGWNGRHMFTLLPYFFYFWCGVVIADINRLDSWGPLRQHPVLCDALGMGGVLLFAISGWRQHNPGSEIEVILLDLARIAGIFAIFIGAILGRRFKAFLSLPVISVLGGACYSIYLCHVQIMQITLPMMKGLIFSDNLWISLAVGTIVQLPLVLVGSMAFYLLIERPFMVRDWPSKALRLVGAGRRHDPR